MKKINLHSLAIMGLSPLVEMLLTIALAPFGIILPPLVSKFLAKGITMMLLMAIRFVWNKWVAAHVYKLLLKLYITFCFKFRK
ncbi:hypothetical protein [Terribacillus sp. JSM ZJ617]|uniref:hypothetical protein n=1 Tax=Terribacillus sp. JSM ZJ617 TaxID=3342119 RepID=UPI0035A81E89